VKRHRGRDRGKRHMSDRWKETEGKRQRNS
jgi:hypothetical protein